MRALLSIAAFLSCAPLARAQVSAQVAAQEAEFYSVDYLRPPEGAVVEVGGLGFLSDGRLVVSTRRGQVWLVENPLAVDPMEARFHLFAEGLWEGLGLAVVEDEIYVVQRTELSRLEDLDRDGTCDRIETLCDDWGVSGNYHEFAYGLPVDARGNFYVSLNVSFFSPKWWHGKAPVRDRGWIVRIAPDGAMTPFASGFRSPCGLGLNAAGDLFETDNQGDWMSVCPIFHVKEGAFYGHPASLDWTSEYRASHTLASDTIPPERAASREKAAVWIPYKWSRSAGNLVADLTGGKFGPFEEQLFVAEMTNGMILRTDLERVNGEYQGAVWPFRQRVGSAVRALFASDGTLMVGMTNRGWGGLSPADGVARVRFTGKAPMEIRHVRLLEEGFELEFTKPLGAIDSRAGHIEAVQYDYNYWWEYGSPETNVERLRLSKFRIGDDRRILRLSFDGLAAGKCVRVPLKLIVADDGTPLLHEEFAYTINSFPGNPETEAYVSKLVPPPPARESGDEGWLFLTWGDALGLWDSSGWELCEAELDPADPRKLRTRAGNGAIVNSGEHPSAFVSKQTFGDCKLHLRFMLPEGGNSGVYLMGRYEVQLCDNGGREPLGSGDLGGIYAGASTWKGRAPDFDAWHGAGQWHELDVDFQAPRFDGANEKVENARFLRVRIDDVLLQENVEVDEPTLGAIGPEEMFGPLLLQGDHSQVAYADVRVYPKVARQEPEGWTPLFDGESLEEWSASGEGEWRVEDGVVIGSGKAGHLFSPRGDYKDFMLRGRFKISDGGNSGLYFRTAFGPGWPAGYEAQINSTHPDPQRTGGLYGLVKNATTIVPPDTWFDYYVRCVDEEAGTHIAILVNGCGFVDFVDTERRYTEGHIALQQHNEGSVIEAKDLWIREL